MLWPTQLKSIFLNVLVSDGSGSKFFDPDWVGSIFCGSGQVGSAVNGLSLNLENFPIKCQIFQLFPFGSKKSLQVESKSTRVKGRLASYLLQVKSKLGSGQGPSLVLVLFFIDCLPIFLWELSMSFALSGALSSGI